MDTSNGDEGLGDHDPSGTAQLALAEDAAAGVETLLAMGAAHAEYGDALVERREAAVEASGVEISPMERAVIASADEATLRQIMRKMEDQLFDEERRHFLGQAAVALGVLVGGSVAGCSKAESPKKPTDKAHTSAAMPAPRPAPMDPSAKPAPMPTPSEPPMETPIARRPDPMPPPKRVKPRSVRTRRRKRSVYGAATTGIRATPSPMGIRPDRMRVPKSRVQMVAYKAGAATNTDSRLRAKIRARIYSLRSVYRRALMDNPRLQGSARISFMVLTTGRVSSVGVSKDLGAKMYAGIKAKVARWRLGKPKAGKAVFVTLKVRFSISSP